MVSGIVTRPILHAYDIFLFQENVRPDYQSVQHLPYMDLVVKESLRLHTIAAVYVQYTLSIIMRIVIIYDLEEGDFANIIQGCIGHAVEEK